MPTFTNRVTTAASSFYRDNLSTISSRLSETLSSTKENFVINSREFKRNFLDFTSKEKLQENINNRLNDIKLGAENLFSENRITTTNIHENFKQFFSKTPHYQSSSEARNSNSSRHLRTGKKDYFEEGMPILSSQAIKENSFKHNGRKVTVKIYLMQHPANKYNPNQNPHLNPELDKNKYENIIYTNFS